MKKIYLKPKFTYKPHFKPWSKERLSFFVYANSMNMYLHRKHTFVPIGLWDIRGRRLQVLNIILLIHFCVSNSHEKSKLIYKRHLYESFDNLQDGQDDT